MLSSKELAVRHRLVIICASYCGRCLAYSCCFRPCGSLTTSMTMKCCTVHCAVQDFIPLFASFHSSYNIEMLYEEWKEAAGCHGDMAHFVPSLCMRPHALYLRVPVRLPTPENFVAAAVRKK
uniref:Uncharacterized protein n=1 Tax=Rhipicephalus pulchellus TaxID=72859 RepID=L7LY31_RHIPC